ncbi:MAG: prepilin-type N-terminal cleavage/methylation domain-containing protein [Candidatus Omnitrophica bacterium]|nr:prepilin-type N-terminal cleavage/methylation domain-containing protein [Candidatus Omnitrophota bacterium]
MNKKGFTLVELLIAAAIFAFVMSGVLLMFINCAFLDQANRNKGIATTHAEFVMEDIMEYMRSGDLVPLQDEIDSGEWYWDSSTTPPIGNYLGCTSPYVYPYVLNSESITTTYVTETNPLDVTVTVSWKDRAQANPRSLTLETLISKR